MKKTYEGIVLYDEEQDAYTINRKDVTAKIETLLRRHRGTSVTLTITIESSGERYEEEDFLDVP